MRLSAQKVKMFKIRNRKGYAAVCKDNLTEGRTPYQAYLRLAKALKRTGVSLPAVDAASVKKLVKTS